MKILLVGASSPYAIERFYLKYLNEISGVQAQLFEAQNFFLTYYHKSILNKILFRIGYKKIYTKINIKLRAKILEFHPDILFVFKGMEVFPQTLRFTKNHGIKAVNYNPDNPFIFSGKGSGNRNITNSFSLYDLHLTYNLEVKNKIEREYNTPVKMLPFGFDVDKDLYIRCLNQSEIIKTCFLGNPDKERAEFIMGLANEGILIDVYGNNWDKFISHSNVIVHSSVYGEDLWKTLRRYRVQLNLMRIHNVNSHNMRSFEVPGVGGIMVAPNTIEHNLYFENQKEIFLYNSVIDCSKTIRELLSFSSTEADSIRQNARTRSIASGYTYKDRAKQLLIELQKL
ncbi:MAG: glycosyltransferase [Segetibacter sp.]